MALIFLTALALVGAPSSAQAPADAGRLAAVLSKAAAYCQKLEAAALDFVCIEEVKETSYNLSPSTNVYIYDYQFVRKRGTAKEQRNLLSFNGKKADLKDTALHTAFFEYRNVLFGPIGLLGRDWQSLFVFRVAGQERLDGQAAMIIDVLPGPALTEPHPYGRVWVSERDGSILKIVWDQRSLGNFKIIDEWAKEHDAEPGITSLSEYGVEKNGLRFPSRSFTEQAYIRKDRGKVPSAMISIIYRDYRFFTVETQTTY